jgi:single-strand DNA-binding protein
MNNIILVGRITKDLELRKTSNGKSMVFFQLAQNNPTKKGETHYLPCVTFDKQADNLVKYCGKGSQLVVRGHLTHKYEKETNKTSVTIFAKEIEYVGGKDNLKNKPTTQTTQTTQKVETQPKDDAIQ